MRWRSKKLLWLCNELLFITIYRHRTIRTAHLYKLFSSLRLSFNICYFSTFRMESWNRYEAGDNETSGRRFEVLVLQAFISLAIRRA